MSLNEDNYISPLQHQEKMIIKREALDDDKFTESDEDGCLQEVFLGSQKVKLEVEQSDNSCERSSELNHFENSTDASFRIKHEPENSLTSALKEEIHIEEYKPAPAGWELAGAGRSGSLEIFKDEFARSESVRESEVQSSGSKSKADVRYNCAHCPYKTNRKGNYIKHYIRKHKQCREVYKCQECSFETKHEYDLTKHHKRKHSEDSKLYKCQECSYITKYKSSLIRHYNRKHVVKEAAEMFKCPECSYEARKKNHLTQHYNNKHK